MLQIIRWKNKVILQYFFSKGENESCKSQWETVFFLFLWGRGGELGPKVQITLEKRYKFHFFSASSAVWHISRKSEVKIKWFENEGKSSAKEKILHISFFALFYHLLPFLALLFQCKRCYFFCLLVFFSKWQAINIR